MSFNIIKCTYTYQLVQIKHVEKKNTYLGPRRRETRRLGTFLMFDSSPTLVVVVVVVVVELWWWWWCCCCTVVAVFVVVVVVVVEVMLS